MKEANREEIKDWFTEKKKKKGRGIEVCPHKY